MTAARRKPSMPRAPLNEREEGNPRDPQNFGPADDLPGKKVRQYRGSVWEFMLTVCDKHGNKTYHWFTEEFKQAADEIERVFTAISSAQFARSQMGDRTGGSRADWSEGLTIAYRDRYKPWANAMAAHGKITTHPVLPFIIDMMQENLTVRECEDRNGIRHGRGLEFIQYGLSMYVEMAGWTRRAKPRRRA